MHLAEHWRNPVSSWDEQLQVAVNVNWLSSTPVPVKSSIRVLLCQKATPGALHDNLVLQRSQSCSGLSGCAWSHRRIFDDVWTQFAKLSSPLGSQLDDDLKAGRLAGSPPGFDLAGAPTTSTRVLVVGATGRCVLSVLANSRRTR